MESYSPNGHGPPIPVDSQRWTSSDLEGVMTISEHSYPQVRFLSLLPAQGLIAFMSSPYGQRVSALTTLHFTKHSSRSRTRSSGPSPLRPTRLKATSRGGSQRMEAAVRTPLCSSTLRAGTPTRPTALAQDQLRSSRPRRGGFMAILTLLWIALFTALLRTTFILVVNLRSPRRHRTRLPTQRGLLTQ